MVDEDGWPCRGCRAGRWSVATWMTAPLPMPVMFCRAPAAPTGPQPGQVDGWCGGIQQGDQFVTWSCYCAVRSIGPATLAEGHLPVYEHQLILAGEH
jgi:hypothetical protein